jgi:hypothetical protein
VTSLPIPVVTAAGSRYQIGHDHGSALGPRLRAFLADGAGRLSHLLPEPVTMAGLRPRVSAYGEAISAAVPALAEEVRGLADGAGISWEEAVLLQVRRELLGYQKVPPLGDCTTYARTALTGAGQPAVAQTVDLSGNLDDQIAVLHLRPAGQARGVLVLSFAGLLGYLGINSDGLAVGLNLVLGGEWRPGVPPYLAIRHILDEAGTVGEAIKILESLPLASSRSFMLCDGREAGWVEVLGDDVHFGAATEPVHANHFLHGSFARADEINVFAAHSSRRRLMACQRALVDLPANAGAEDHFALLSQPPIRVAGTGDIRTERTVAAAVMLPWRGELHLRPGDPSRSATQVFRLATEPGDGPIHEEDA